MNQHEEPNEEAAPGIKPHDVLVSVFKHKWKLILCTLAGLGLAAALWFTHLPVYETKAKIFVKSVTVWHPDQQEMISIYDDTIIQPEVAIIESWDVAGEVAKTVGADRIVPFQLTGDREGAAASHVMKNLQVNVSPKSKIIEVAYRHPNPETAVAVLSQILVQYENKHNRVHHPPEILNTLDGQKVEVRVELVKIEQTLKELKKKAGIDSLADGATAINSKMISTDAELRVATVKLAGQRARVENLEKALGVAVPETTEKAPAAANLPPPNPRDVQAFETLSQTLIDLGKEEQRLLGPFQADSTEVRNIRARIRDCEAELARLSKANPTMKNAATPVFAKEGSKIDLNMERAQLKDLEAQHEELKKAYAAIQKSYAEFLAQAPEIKRLEQDQIRLRDQLIAKEIKMDNARFRQLDQKADENIEIIQQPSPPTPSTDKLLKIMLGVAAGGFAMGMGLIFLREFVIDQSVRQPLELETRLGIPLMMSIPDRPNGLPNRTGKGESAEIVPWEEGHFIRPFAEAIRDRLVLHFEQSGLIRKPKLVGVTGWTAGAGTTTLATGLAAALSETGDGKVLLVDMNVRGGEVHPFFQGQAAALLPDALRSSDNVKSTAENLYIATATTQNGEMEIIPKRFYNMIPNFKASDYDYIIFDMPPLSKGSMTLAMAGFMDRTLLVVEAEKDNRNVLKRACSELVQAKANLCGVLNKVRSYGPRWLQEA